MSESMRFCYVAHSTKRIEIFLSHIKDKNKFKNRDSLFLWFNVSRLLIVTFFIQYFKITIYFIGFNVLKLFLYFTHKKTFCISIHYFPFYSFIYICM